jgi:hypothetical protein
LVALADFLERHRDNNFTHAVLLAILLVSLGEFAFGFRFRGIDGQRILAVFIQLFDQGFDVWLPCFVDRDRFFREDEFFKVVVVVLLFGIELILEERGISVVEFFAIDSKLEAVARALNDYRFADDGWRDLVPVLNQFGLGIGAFDFGRLLRRWLFDDLFCVRRGEGLIFMTPLSMTDSVTFVTSPFVSLRSLISYLSCANSGVVKTPTSEKVKNIRSMCDPPKELGKEQTCRYCASEFASFGKRSEFAKNRAV